MACVLRPRGSAAAHEGLGFRDSLVRGRRLASADYVHALGSLCALAIVYFITRLMLLLLLHGQADAAVYAAAFVADLVVSPLLFLGPRSSISTSAPAS